MSLKYVLFALLLSSCLYAQEAPTGSIVEKKGREKKQLAALAGTVTGSIVWASSRSNSKHDLWIMNADGTGIRQLTRGDNVDWYSRFSPDGRQVLFARSKSGWVPEGDAEIFDKWDLWTINIDGSNETKVVESACWGSWRPSGDSIVFARGSEVFIKNLADKNETMLFNAEEHLKKGAYAQQPQLSADGNKLAMTVRGSRRETGIWNLAQSTWYPTGAGCQMEWFPNDTKILRMNEGQGNGGTEVLCISVDTEGKPVDKISGLSIPKKIRFMDLRGRRSHEYFAKTDQTGTWLVWGATQYGHEHDLADYELFIWKVGSDKKKGPVRLTFHSGNDRWPDMYLGEPKSLPAPAEKKSAVEPPAPDETTSDGPGKESVSASLPADSSAAKAVDDSVPNSTTGASKKSYQQP